MNDEQHECIILNRHSWILGKFEHVGHAATKAAIINESRDAVPCWERRVAVLCVAAEASCQH